MFNAGWAGMMNQNQGQTKGGGKGANADPKSALNQMLQKIAQRPLGKGDIIFTVNQFDSQYQAIVKLHCLEGKEYAGHLCTSQKDAEKSAAEQAMIANAPLLAQIQQMPKPQKKRAAGAEPGQPATKKPKVPIPNLPFKTDLNNTLVKIIGRSLVKDEATYIVNQIAPGQHQATLQISCLGEEWTGKAWAGEVKPTKQEAEQSAAEQALRDVSVIAPAQKEKKSASKSGTKKPKASKQEARQEQAMQQMAELMTAWSEEVSKQEEQSLATKMMLWMMNGAKGKPPRETVTAEPVTGTVVTWKGKWGYLKPDAPLNHEGEAQKDGKVWVGIKDLAGGLTELAEGMSVKFKVYFSTEGLGATECSVV
eukprot:TRINITY_DN3188_c0_g1_i1.p1 TRINITY_DN3188_c0_g1~~TRINITY_DN3188_c0_g1_i1.p1  ORF type:complete len:365 (+),score=86.30 TRINITY_DN3188_c0_g1_i1:69-1163(+)